MSDFTNRIDNLINQGKKQEAIAYCRNFLNQKNLSNNQATEAMLALAKICVEIDGKEKEAIKWATEVLKVNSTNAEAWFVVAKARFLLRDNNGAEKAYDMALIANPNYEEALRGKAALLSTLERNWEVVEIGKHLVRISPHKGDGWRVQAFAYIGLAHQENKPEHSEKAIKCAEKAIELQPDVVGGYQMLADALYQQKRYEDALRIINTALRLEPDNELLVAYRPVLEKEVRKSRRGQFWKDIGKMFK